MSAKSAAFLGFGLGVLAGAPLVAPIVIWLLDRSLSKADVSPRYDKWPK